jgi:hypothetical protein
VPIKETKGQVAAFITVMWLPSWNFHVTVVMEFQYNHGIDMDHRHGIAM